MGFWNKLGKIALTAAPYVAAPFTGGASLMATGLANKAVQKWSEKDAQKNMAKGLAPSKFDSVLGKVGNVASTASMFIPGGQLGALGKVGQAANAAGKIGKVANIANKVNQGMSMAGDVMGALRNQNQGQQQPQMQPMQQSQTQGRMGGIGPSRFPQQRSGSWGTNSGLPPYAMNMQQNRRPQASYAYGR